MITQIERREIGHQLTYRHASPESAGLGSFAAWTVSIFAITSMLWYCTFSPLFDVRMVDSPFSAALRLSSLGTITVPDLALLATLLALAGSRMKNLDRLDVIAIATGAWILLAGLVNVYLTRTMDLSRFANYTVRLAPYWLVLPLLRRLPYKQKCCVLITAGVMAVLVAGTHIYVVLTKNESLLLKLYYAWWQPGSLGNAQMRYFLETQPQAFVRAVPDGMALITSVYIACLTGLAADRKRTWLWGALATICACAALVTLERSLAMILLIVMPAMGMIRYRFTRISLRLFLGPLAAAAAFLAIAAVSDYDLTSQFLQRFNQLSADVATPDNPRLLDTLQSVRDVEESPVFGTGRTEPRTFETEAGADAHGLIMLGLVGGVPLMILTLLAVYYSVSMGLRSNTWHRTAGAFVVLQVVALMAINTAPGFVWIRSLLPTIIGMAVATSLSQVTWDSRRAQN